jgi:hypothetical protein
VETVGPQITKVDVKLAGVNLSLLSGSGSIKGLVVGNPPGYKSPHAISVGSSSVSIKPSSVLSDKVVVRSIRIENPDINYEGDVMTDNLRKILDNVKSGSSGTTTTNAPPPTESKAGKLQVDEFVITGAKMHWSSMGSLTLTIYSLPDIKLPPLGQGRKEPPRDSPESYGCPDRICCEIRKGSDRGGKKLSRKQPTRGLTGLLGNGESAQKK